MNFKIIVEIIDSLSLCNFSVKLNYMGLSSVLFVFLLIFLFFFLLFITVSCNAKTFPLGFYFEMSADLSSVETLSLI